MEIRPNPMPSKYIRQKWMERLNKDRDDNNSADYLFDAILDYLDEEAIRNLKRYLDN